MKKAILLFVALGALSACAHTDLKAPCGPVASLSATDAPCNPKPINTASLDVREVL